MTYSEIKTKIGEVSRNIISIDSSIKTLEGILEADAAEISEKERTLASSKQATKEKEFQAHLNQGLKELRENLQSTSAELDSERRKLEEEVEKLSPESFAVGNTDKLIRKVESTTSMVEDKIKANLGERLFGEVKGRFNKLDIPINEKGLKKSLNNLSRYNSQIKKQDKRGKGPGVVDKIEGVLDAKVDTSSPTTYILYFGLLIASIVFATWVVPILLCITVAVCVRNIQNMSLYYKALIECYKLQKNRETLEKSRKKAQNNLYQQEVQNIQEVHGEKIKSLEDRVNSINTQIIKKTVELKENFKFDEQKIEKGHASYLNAKNAAREDTKKKIAGLKQQREESSKKLTELKSMLDNSIGLIKEEYLNPSKLGESQECLTEVLLDVVDNAPVFFDFQRSSCFFVYKDLKDVVDFIRLFVFQIRSRMDSDLSVIDIWDSKTLGSSFRDLTAQDVQLVGISATDDDIREDLRLKGSMLLKRVGKIKRGYQNIFEYNKYLQSIDSILEPYMFVFCLDQPAELFSDDTEAALLGDASFDAGIFVLYFVSEQDMKKDQKYLELVDKFTRAYLIDRGEVTPKARTYLKKLYTPLK